MIEEVGTGRHITVRAALVERIAAVRPALIAIVAPAGFGKTTFVRQIVDGRGAVVVCDLRGADSPLELARRIVPALAGEMPERELQLAQAAARFVEGGSAEHDAIAHLLAAWSVDVGSSTFVFEHAEDAVADQATRDFFAQLLAARPAARTIVISSRAPLRIHFSRFAAPHEVFAVRADDLAFSQAEVASILASAGADDRYAERITQITAGWPIAVLLFTRFAVEGRIEALLDRLDDLAFEELHDYLADEVLAALPPSLVDALVACAALPAGTYRDLLLALGDAALTDAVVAFARSSPFVTRRSDDTYDVHVLLRALLRERYPERSRAALARAIAANEGCGDLLRAAQLAIANDDRATAARLLVRCDVSEDRAPTLAYANVLNALDRATILRHPRLWSVTARIQIFATNAHVLLAEAEDVWSDLADDTDPNVRLDIAVLRVILRMTVGRFREVPEILSVMRDAFVGDTATEKRAHAWLAYLRALVAAASGQFAEVRQTVASLVPLSRTMEIVASGALLLQATEVERVLGERIAESALIERAIATIRYTHLRNFLGLALAEATFGAWLAGDEDERLRYALALANEVTREGIAGFAFFVACARRHEAEPRPTDALRWTIAGHLIAAAEASDLALAREYAHAARAAALRYHSPFLTTLAHLALVATSSGSERREHGARALASAERLAAPAFAADVQAALSGRPGGTIGAFLSRFDRAERPARSTYTIDFADGSMRRDGTIVKLSERETALVFAIAMRPEPIARERLCDLLWPDLDEDAARNAFHVCLHRIKTRLACDDFIVRTNAGYQLRGDIAVDLRQVDRDIMRVRAGSLASADRFALLERLAEQLSRSRPARFDDWEWFAPVARHLRELRGEVAQARAIDAFATGDVARTLAIANDMIAFDPCDEPAREIAIKAYLASGDRAAALRHVRQYRETLAAELQCEPSAAILKLIGET